MEDPSTIRRLYGRSKGRPLRAAQAALVERLLPALSVPEEGPIDARSLFGDDRPLHFEIGFGGGEHLVAQAAAHPAVGLVGCEPFINGVAMALGRIAAARVGNVRLHPGDARDLVELVPDGTVARVFLLYPDPWPKTRHHRRRFAGPENLAMLARVMAPGAELRLATDIAGYAEHARDAVALTPGLRLVGDGGEPWTDWPGTRYEAKALTAGRQPTYLTLVRD
jgi:tRNA (guanine-N7-)-methyltransferase